MNIARIGMACVSITLCSCGTVPSFKIGAKTTEPPTVAELVTHIQCEIWNVMTDNGTIPAANHALFTHEYVAFAQLTVDVTNFEGTAPSLNFISPYMNPMENLTKTIGGQYSGTQHRNMTQAFTVDLHIPVSANANQCLPHPGKESRLKGDLGLKAVIESGLAHVAYDNFVFQRPGTAKKIPKLNPIAVPVFGSTVDFTIVYGLGNVGPTWTLTRFKGPGGGGGGGGGGMGTGSGSGSGSGGGGSAQGLLTLTRTEKDTLVISFAPANPDLATPAAAAATSPSGAALAEEKVNTNLSLLAERLQEQINALEVPPDASQAERTNITASQVLAASSLMVAEAVSALKQQSERQTQATEQSTAIKAAQDNNTRMILQNLLTSP